MLEVLDLSESGVLAACAEEVAERIDLDASSAALVEEGEGFFEVGGLRLVGHGCRVSLRLIWYARRVV